MPTIAVTGASGHLAARVAETLIDRGETPVLLSRNPGALRYLAQLGADVRHGDLADSAGLRAALTGVDRLLLVSTDGAGPTRVALHAQGIEAARAAGVRHVVYTSLSRPEAANPALVAADHRATEATLRASGLAWTFLRNNLYAEALIPAMAEAIATGRLVTNTGDGATAYISRDDCAAVAAAVLRGEGHEGAIYDLTGPEALDAADLAALFGAVGRRGIDVVDADDATFARGLEAAGRSVAAAALQTSLGVAARTGWTGGVSTAFAELTGAEPMSLHELLAGDREPIRV